MFSRKEVVRPPRRLFSLRLIEDHSAPKEAGSAQSRHWAISGYSYLLNGHTNWRIGIEQLLSLLALPPGGLRRNMRWIFRLCIYGGLAYGGWQYYWSKLHCLEYGDMGVCLRRCEKWEGWECTKKQKAKPFATHSGSAL